MDPKPDIEHAHESDAPPRNFLTHFDETLSAIASVEQKPGSQWLREQSDEEADRHHNNAANARRWLLDTARRKKKRFILYGDGGMGRWRVYPDGRVTFIQGMKAGSEADALRAKEFGFPIEGPDSSDVPE